MIDGLTLRIAGKRDPWRCGILSRRHKPGDIMTTPAHDLAAEVLDLPAEERARILELLIASFEPKTTAQKAWMELALRRREEVRSGKVAMIPGDEALARVRARIA
jgi:putative addiction module component (TIGR02574 family)